MSTDASRSRLLYTKLVDAILQMRSHEAALRADHQEVHANTYEHCIAIAEAALLSYVEEVVRSDLPPTGLDPPSPLGDRDATPLPPGEALAWAFVQGAKWWEWYKTGATMWQADQARAYAAAAEKYAPLPVKAPTEDSV